MSDQREEGWERCYGVDNYLVFYGKEGETPKYEIFPMRLPAEEFVKTLEKDPEVDRIYAGFFCSFIAVARKGKQQLRDNRGKGKVG